ncbi:MAG: glycosyltransferase family 2 protein [Anaerolineae bacterium]|nr:glycosyltransferase family 2 protein [Anaerolineae bacterium]
MPVYNEEAAIDSFHRQLTDALTGLPQQFNIIYVDDGSRDDTLEHLHALAEEDRRINVIELSRNFGHQAALCAGIDQARGDFVITLDGDGQHPPALIAEMLTLAEGGYDIVLTQRLDEEQLPFFKRFTSRLFYQFTNHIAETDITPASSDFRLMSRSAVEALRSMPEYHRFLRGMVAWIGFRSIILPFKPPQRLAGESKYSLNKMVRLAMDAIFSFSLMPLYIGISIGGLFLLAALAEVVYVLNFWIRGDTSHLAPGWSSLMFMLLVVGGARMVFMGITGIYIGYIFQEVKHRPIYIIRNIYDKTENQKEQVS